MSLSTLIVQREIASIREVEEALARQVLYGGDLVTNLLEVCRLDEAALLPIVAESLGLPPAPPGELPRPAVEAMRLVASEVASQRNLAPISVDRYGLTLAVAEPLTPEVEQELSFALAMPISTRIAPLVRIRQALTRDYGIPLDKRFQRLLQRMTGTGPRTSSSYPPMRAVDARMGAPRPPSAAPAPLPFLSQPVRPSGLAGGRTLVRTTASASLRPPRRRRGAITVEAARTELEEATERDGIFDLLFDFARQYFDYTAVFVVHGDIAEGRDAFGDGAARERVARIGVPLDLPSVLATVRDKKKALQRVPDADGLDAILMSDLGRPGRTLCVVLPVIVRGRVVAMLLGDGGDTGIDPQTLGDVESIVALASGAFERLIVRRKLKGTMPPGREDSVLPAGMSLAPPTKVSEISNRPSAEELAPPIRELMAIAETQPNVEPPSALATYLSQPPVSSKVPPPPNGLTVRRPSGAPIPREEPRSSDALPAVTPGSLAPSSSPSVAPSSERAPKSRRRLEAPKLEFQSVPGPVPSMFGSESFGTDEVERQLLAEIHGRTSEPPRHIIPPDNEPTLMSFEDPVSSATTSPLSSEVDPPVTGHSPGIVTPRVIPQAPFVMPPIETTPFGPPPRLNTPPAVPAVAPIPEFESYDGPPSGVESDPMSRRDTPVGDEDPAPLPPPSSSQMLSAADADVVIVDTDPTPLTPMVDMDGLTPIHPPVSTAVVSSGLAPVPSRPMPPSEQVVSVAAHRPPSARNQSERDVLPSVIVDVASEYVSLVERVLNGARHGATAQSMEDAENELLRAGGHAMPAIMARFPGPLTVEPERLNEGPLPRVAECGPVLRLIASQRRTALPFVLSHVTDPLTEKRFWATYLLTELVYPDVLEPVLSRVFDEDYRIRRVARAAARAFADAHPGIIVERLELVAMDAGERRGRRVVAVDTLGETRETLSVPALIPLLDDPDVEIANTARTALTVVTRQDFGNSAQKWSLWWAQNHDRHRLEWLIDALMHDHAALRALAGEELKTTTKEYFGYYDDLPKRERERAQSRYREWWNSIGRVRFSRSSSSRG